MRVKMKMTLTAFYEASSRFYETDDPVEMAKVDEDNLNSKPSAIDEFLIYVNNYTIKVEPIED